MPKIVDVGERRTLIADSALTVIARDGLDGATLARVAAEAGLAIGSVRHFVPTIGEVVDLAIQRMMERVAGRINARLTREAGPAMGLEILSELLPLDPDRHVEAAAWLALMDTGRHRPELRAHLTRLHDGTRKLARAILTPYQRKGAIAPGDQALTLEIEHLAALVDGLMLAAMIAPTGVDPRMVLERHFRTLAGSKPTY